MAEKKIFHHPKKIDLNTKYTVFIMVEYQIAVSVDHKQIKSF